MIKTCALSNLRTSPCDVMGLLSELICFMKFCYHRDPFGRRDVLLCIIIIIFIVSETMISVSNTCV